MTNSSTERRAHQRVDRAIDLEGAADPEGVVARMTTYNLSLGGLYCTSTVDFPEMTRLAVRVLLPVQEGPDVVDPLDLEAVVVRRKPLESPSGGSGRFELALFFPHLDDVQKDRLRDYVHE